MNLGRGRRAPWVSLGAAALATTMAACTAPSDASEDVLPTEAEVEALLESAHAARANLDELCDLATAELNCRASLEVAPTPPERAPTLACTGTFDAPEGHVDGTLARVRGVDGEGTEYDSTILAVQTGDGTRFVDPVYWAASKISTGDTTDESDIAELDC